MSRVIKFRVWNNLDKKMLDVGVVNLYWKKIRASKDYELMQFTGLHDVNGVEIYEGDIVSVPGIGNAEIKICQCYGVCYKVSGKYGYTGVPYIDCAAENDYPTIIGNIYQNPELFNQ